jgi:hypothetical protein
MNLEKIVLDLKKSDPKLFQEFYDYLKKVESAANHVSETTTDSRTPSKEFLH